ncbi:MAG: hypothetical protein R2939_11065 [Kofleriaceae bacterium]
MARARAAVWVLVVAWGGCGAGPGPAGPRAGASIPLVALLGQPLEAPAVVEFTAGVTPTESAADERRWPVVGKDFACDLVALRGSVAGAQVWRTSSLTCARATPAARAGAYAGGLPSGLTWASSEHAFRRAAYEAAPIRERLSSDGHDEGTFAGRPLPSIDAVTFTFPRARLFPVAIAAAPPPTEPATPTEGWWATWQAQARTYGFTERERRFVRIDVPTGTNQGSGRVTLPTTPGRRYVVIAWVEFADGGNLALVGTRAEPRPKIGPIANTAVGMVWYGGAVASGDQLVVEVAANNASVHTRCSLWLFHADGAPAP